MIIIMKVKSNGFITNWIELVSTENVLCMSKIGTA